METLIFDIKRYAINDGPGVRTTVFMKGCPLRCVWCHNPEGWTTASQVLFKKSRCIDCGTCRKASFNIDDCPTKARETCGRKYTLHELMEEVEKERDIMQMSGGGVTLCGGEPLMHTDDTLMILHELGCRGFHRAVDTTLYAEPDIVDKVASECELLLVDIKTMNSEKHRLYTGADNELILRNIQRIAKQGRQFLIRIPLIEGINADEENIEQTALFLGSVSPKEQITVHLLPYHDVGKDKHLRIGSIYNPGHISMATPSDKTLARCVSQLETHGLRVVIGG